MKATATVYRKEFQFLIGWLQTQNIPRFSFIDKRFQFLIGWLQTLNGLSPTYAACEFQFLIGWLQTIMMMMNL